MCLAFWETLKNRNQMEDFSFTVHPFCFEFEEFQFKKKKMGCFSTKSCYASDITAQ